MAWILRAMVIATAIVLFTTGDVPYALFGVGAGILAFVPTLVARSLQPQISGALELPLLWVIVTDLTVGRLCGVYELLPWYDKALHCSDTFLIAAMAFVVAYLLHFIGHTHRNPWIDGVVIFSFTLGLGALWEIGEYLVDRWLGRATQGSPQMPPFDDTMIDLMLDAAGGLLAAIVGPIYMRHSKRSRLRIEAFAALMSTRSERLAQAQADQQPHRD